MSFANEAEYLGKRVNLLEEQNRALLEALRYYVDQHERWRFDMPERNENDGKAWDRTRKLALEAIAKATNPNSGEAQAYPAGRWTGGGK
jgi:hypothetical protein